MGLDQLIIIICGPLSVYLSQSKKVQYHKWACILALISQPAWFVAAYNASQWGIFWTDVAFTWAWGVGVYNHWVRKSK